jgi:hypothetical protein
MIPALLIAGETKMIGNWTHDVEGTIQLFPGKLDEGQKEEIRKGYSGGIYLNISDKNYSGRLGQKEFKLPYTILEETEQFTMFSIFDDGETTIVLWEFISDDMVRSRSTNSKNYTIGDILKIENIDVFRRTKEANKSE